MSDIAAVFLLVDQGKPELAIGRFEVIHGPHASDLAVCRLRPDETLPYVELADSDCVCEGDLVFTCGFPLGSDLQPGSPAGSLFQRGIVSGIRAHALIQPRRRFLIDMTVNPGNSGGPLCSESNGLIIGIVDAQILDRDTRLPVGIGAAVPCNLAKPLIQCVLSLTDEDLNQMKDGIWPSSTGCKA